MSVSKFFILACLSLFGAASALADVDLYVGQSEALRYCGGTVSVNNGGNDNQLNLVFSGVDSCKFLTVNDDGRESSYELSGNSGNFHNSYTLTTAQQETSGWNVIRAHLQARDGTPYENINIYFRVTRY